MIVLEGLQKKFGKQHILQSVSHTFETGSKTVILGSNGSGKSTLIKILSGALEATEGAPTFSINNTVMEAKSIGLCVGIAAPYVDSVPFLKTLTRTIGYKKPV